MAGNLMRDFNAPSYPSGGIAGNVKVWERGLLRGEIAISSCACGSMSGLCIRERKATAGSAMKPDNRRTKLQECATHTSFFSCAERYARPSPQVTLASIGMSAAVIDGLALACADPAKRD